MSLTKRSECTYATFAAGFARQDQVADRVHQVRLAETDAAVDEQRVVRAAGILRDLKRRRARELVALAFDEALERESLVEPRRRASCGRAHLGLGPRPARLAPRRRPAADLDLDLRRAVAVTRPPRADLLEAVAS